MPGMLCPVAVLHFTAVLSTAWYLCCVFCVVTSQTSHTRPAGCTIISALPPPPSATRAPRRSCGRAAARCSELTCSHSRYSVCARVNQSVSQFRTIRTPQSSYLCTDCRGFAFSSASACCLPAGASRAASCLRSVQAHHLLLLMSYSSPVQL